MFSVWQVAPYGNSCCGFVINALYGNIIPKGCINNESLGAILENVTNDKNIAIIGEQVLAYKVLGKDMNRKIIITIICGITFIIVAVTYLYEYTRYIDEYEKISDNWTVDTDDSYLYRSGKNYNIVWSIGINDTDVDYHLYNGGYHGAFGYHGKCNLTDKYDSLELTGFKLYNGKYKIKYEKRHIKEQETLCLYYMILTNDSTRISLWATPFAPFKNIGNVKKKYIGW